MQVGALALLKVSGYKKWSLRIALDLLLIICSLTKRSSHGLLHESMPPSSPSSEPAPGSLDSQSPKLNQINLFSV